MLRRRRRPHSGPRTGGGLPAGARPAGGPATGVGCGSTVGEVPLDTTYNTTTGRYELDDPVRGHHRTYDMEHRTSGNGTLVTDDDNVWCEGGEQADAVAAHYIHAVFWDYYLSVHGRKGVRGDGRAPCSRVHYGNMYVNAFYSLTSSCMTYGDGTDPRRPLTRIDVGAHEMAHGVTAATAGLNYFGETAGLGESVSDAFAVAVEFHAANKADPGDYRIAEHADLIGDKTLRHLDRPSKDGASKDYWYPRISEINPAYAAGPANHFFYLLAEGSGPKVINSVFYDSPTYDGVPVTGIGRAAAEKVLFKALTERMTPNSNYQSVRAATLYAAAGLYGPDSPEHRAVGAAWAAVNVR
ncbi:M4 family metallopeptidase [Streptomyces stramineus]